MHFRPLELCIGPQTGVSVGAFLWPESGEYYSLFALIYEAPTNSLYVSLGFFAFIIGSDIEDNRDED